jgi:hypothetical protein
MTQNKTLSTGILVPDSANEAVRVNIMNLDLADNQSVTVEVLNWGFDPFGSQVTSNLTPMLVTPSSPITTGPGTQQSFIVLLPGPPLRNSRFASRRPTMAAEASSIGMPHLPAVTMAEPSSYRHQVPHQAGGSGWRKAPCRSNGLA